jgi:hypothetical protein
VRNARDGLCHGQKQDRINWQEFLCQGARRNFKSQIEIMQRLLIARSPLWSFLAALRLGVNPQPATRYYSNRPTLDSAWTMELSPLPMANRETRI